MPQSTVRHGIDSRKTREELIAELEHLRKLVPEVSNQTGPQMEMGDWFQEGGRPLRLLTDALPVQISYVDKDLRYRYVNQAYEKWFGHPREWVIGRHVSEVLGELAYQALRGYMERALAGESVTYEDSVFYQTGGNRYVHGSYIPHFNEDRTVSGFFVTVTDISERWKAEEALREANEQLESRVEERTEELRESENLLNRIFEEIPATLAIKDQDGRYLKTSKAWSDLFQIEEKDYIGKTAEEISSYTSEQAQEISRDDLAVIKGKTPVTQLIQHLLDRNGVERVFDTRKVPLWDQDGNAIGLISIGLDITESRKAELAKRESEGKLKAVVDHSPSTIILKDLEGRYLQVNPSFEKWHGVSSEAVIGKTIYDLIPTEFANLIAEQEKTVLRSGQMDIREIEMPTLNRPDLSIINTIFPVKDAVGRIIGIGTIGTDNTGQKQAEKALNASERMLQTVFNTLPVGVQVKDRSGRYIMVNQKLASFYGQTPQELIGKRFGDLDVGTEPQKEQIDEDDRKVIETGETLESSDAQLLLPDGKTLWRRRIKAPLKDSAGNVVGIVGVMEDITERMEAEKNLKKSEALLRSFVDHSPGAIILKDLEGRYLMVNPAFRELNGDMPNEVIGKTVYDLLPRDFAEAISEQEQKVLETGQTDIREIHRPTPDHGTLSFLNTKFPVRDGDGNLIAIGTIGTDITERKQAEQALSASETQFKELVEGSIQGVLIHREGKVVFANQACADIFGYENPEEVLQIENPFDLVAPEERERLLSIFSRRLKGKDVPGQYQFRGMRKDGTLLWIDNSARIVSWKGKPAAQSTFIDITDRMEAEKNLKKSEELVRSIVDNSPCAIILKDLKGRYLLINRAFKEMNEDSPNEVIGKTAEDFFSREYSDAIVEQEKKVVETGQTDIREIERATVKGATLSFLNTKFPVRDADGAIIAIGTISTDITERRQAEKALRSSQRLLEAVFDTIPHTLFIRDLDSKYLMLNRAGTERYNLAPEDYLGIQLLDVSVGTEEERRKLLEDDRRVLESGQRFENPDYPITQPDGTVRYFSNINLPLRDAEGEVAGLVGISEDITERKLESEKLRESEELFRSTVDNSPTTFFMKDLEGRLIMVNPQFEKWTGIGGKDMIGKKPSEIFPEEISGLFDSQDDEVVETGRAVSEEMDVPSADGIRKIVRTKFPVKNAAGEPIAIGSIISDITARRRAEEKLHQSRDQLRLITDNLPAIILYIDSDERYVFINKTGEQWFNNSSDRLIGTTIRENLKEQEYSKIKPYIDQALSGQETRFESQISYPDGNDRNLDMTFIPNVDSDGTVKGYFALGRDITEFKSLEEKLRQSQKMEALGTLTGGIAHDFNNILAPILGFSEILLEKAEPSTKDYQNLQSIFKSAVRAKDLVSQIMLFSRRSETTKVNSDLRTVAREIIGLLHSSFPKSISVQAEISSDPTIVFCDPSQIYRVLLNLCVNAEQALDETGEVNISLGVANLDGITDFMGNILSGNYIRLAVSDNGTGMDADTLPHIFEPFFTKREVGEGTGLGLSTVFGIVKSHDGGIVVNSKPGEGSTFEIFLPRTEEPPEIFHEFAASVPTGSETILFVDDEEEIVLLAKETLEAKGYRVMTFTDPIKALESFKAVPGRIDLILTDQSMPRMKGELLVKDIRKIDQRIPIILFTGYSHTISPESGKAIGINKFLYKPLGTNDMCRAVREVLDEAAV